METAKKPLLVAYRDQELSAEAARQLVDLAADSSRPRYAGEDLPLADKAALLRKVPVKGKKD